MVPPVVLVTGLIHTPTTSVGPSFSGLGIGTGKLEDDHLGTETGTGKLETGIGKQSSESPQRGGL